MSTGALAKPVMRRLHSTYMRKHIFIGGALAAGAGALWFFGRCLPHWAMVEREMKKWEDPEFFNYHYEGMKKAKIFQPWKPTKEDCTEY